MDLGTACNFAVLAGTGIVRSGASTVIGDLGSHPTYTLSGTGSIALTGTDYGSSATTAQAKSDLDAAYSDAQGRTPTLTVATELGATTRGPGVYNTLSGTFGLTGVLTLDAAGDTAAVFIFQALSTLTTAAASSVALINGAQGKNVFWVLGSTATLGATSTFNGTIIARTTISLGATVNLAEARVLALDGQVGFDGDSVTTTETCATAASPTPTSTETFTPTVSETSTPTITETSTPTVSETSTPTVSETSTPTVSETSTPTVSETSTPAITETSTPTVSETSTPTVSETSTPTVTETGTRTITATGTPSASGTSTGTPTSTHSPVSTFTASGTITPTSSPTATGTASPTATGTASPSSTATPPSTSTPSPTITVTFTASPSNTPSPCTTATPGLPAGESYIYPSPARGAAATLAFWMSRGGDISLKVYNQTGRLASTTTASKPGGWQQSQVEVGGFASGAYYYVLTLHYADGATEVQPPRKFLVLH